MSDGHYVRRALCRTAVISDGRYVGQVLFRKGVNRGCHGIPKAVVPFTTTHCAFTQIAVQDGTWNTGHAEGIVRTQLCTRAFPDAVPQSTVLNWSQCNPAKTCLETNLHYSSTRCTLCSLVNPDSPCLP